MKLPHSTRHGSIFPDAGAARASSESGTSSYAFGSLRRGLRRVAPTGLPTLLRLAPAVMASQFTVKTANRQGSDLIQSTIINDLIEEDLVIADLTEHNPNVMFELGIRMAEDKPVVLIKALGTGPLFDVDNMLRVFEYSSNLWQTTIEKDMPSLREFIKGAWENRASEKSYMKILRGAKFKAV